MMKYQQNELTDEQVKFLQPIAEKIQTAFNQYWEQRIGYGMLPDDYLDETGIDTENLTEMQNDALLTLQTMCDNEFADARNNFDKFLGRLIKGGE